ncbi:MAG: hypothetical protein EXS32_03655 [Opitutus sp.]|nr:hypothetical protein [Opitutus sp.]
MNKLLVGLAGFGTVLIAGVLVMQRATMGELRDEIAALRTDVQQAAKQSKDVTGAPHPQAPVVAVVAPENGAGDEQRTEFAKLRDEIRGLKTSTQEIVQFARMATAAAAAKNMDTSGIPNNLTPVGALKNTGKNTPAQAMESLLYAASGGDVDLLAEGLVLEPKAKQKAADWFAALPDATRSQYGSPEKVLALMLARDAATLTGMQVLGQQEIKPDLMAVRVRMQVDGGKTKDETMPFYRAPDGWRMILPQDFLEKQMKALAGGGK